MNQFFAWVKHKLKGRPWLTIVVFLIGLRLVYVLYLWVPKPGHIYYEGSHKPAAGVRVYTRHYRDYRWTIGMEKLRGECTLLEKSISSKNGQYGVGWVPLSRRDIVSVRKQLTYRVNAYIPPKYHPVTGEIEKTYRVTSNIYQEGEWPPDLKVISSELNVLERVLMLSKIRGILSVRCHLPIKEHDAMKEDLDKAVRKEAEKLFPLWLEYLRSHPYNKGESTYSSDKTSGDVFFIRIFGNDVRPLLNAAEYPNAKKNCPELYKGLKNPKGIKFDKSACF